MSRDEEAIRLFDEQAVTIARHGTRVVLVVDSEEEAELLFQWLIAKLER